ncbi:hypothetical protein B0H14DRAFT_2625530 [Mycena olivaceomarginata]|nr:hypothetical protein B0H14DRAFT_2625530 [Mycena olivaceomarginata]
MENVSHADMLKVIIGSSVAAFAALEPFMLLTRRSGIPCEVEDVECGQPNAVFEPLLPIPEKQLEKHAHTTGNKGLHGLDREGRKKSHCNLPYNDLDRTNQRPFNAGNPIIEPAAAVASGYQLRGDCATSPSSWKGVDPEKTFAFLAVPPLRSRPRPTKPQRTGG